MTNDMLNLELESLKKRREEEPEQFFIDAIDYQINDLQEELKERSERN